MSADLGRPRPLFKVGDRVVRAKSPEVIGEVLSEGDWDCGDYWYAVRFERRKSSVTEYELTKAPEEGEEVQDLAMQGRWGQFSALRRAVAVERILRQNRSTVYAFNAQRIQFLPHQYKPLLKVLETDDRRLLVADEVGLGKTIEAGLILAELQARQKLETVLVVCPSRLREKWRDEMERKFRQEFEIWTTTQIRDYLDRIRRNPARTPFKAVASLQVLRQPDLLEEFLTTAPDLDLLIFDEAHHARNRGTATFRMAQELGRRCDGYLMLTATPLHLGTDDLFHLLTILREDEFRDAVAFQGSMLRNEGVVLAQRIVRARASNRFGEAAHKIREAGGLLGESSPNDPLIAEVLRALEGPPPEGHDQWLDLERLLEQAHVLSHVLTRTKKRDVYEKTPDRNGRWRHVQWTPAEHEMYCQLAGLDPRIPTQWQSAGFGQMQRARQAASSIHGTILYSGRFAGVAEQSDLDEDDDTSAVEPVSFALPPTDSKYEELRSVLRSLIDEDPTRKILVFTFFRGTSRYLEERLVRDGFAALRIDGDIPSNPRDPEHDERAKIIRRFENDPGARVLVSTEVGSEGLDFQFCACLVNYDLPWNPMVVEQRIGRIDRFGQKAEKLHIVSLVVQNTIEDRILEKLYDRIGLFERAVGDLESIVGEEMNELRREFFSRRLTAAELERRAEVTARVLAKRARDSKLLEEKAEELVGHEDFIRDEVRRVRRLGRYLTEAQIRTVLDGYFESNHPDIRIQDMAMGVMRIRLTNRLLEDLDRASEPGEYWAAELRARSVDGYLLATTDGALAYNDARLDLLNARHPLVRTAAESLEGLLREPIARVGSVRLTTAAMDAEDEFPRGTYFLAVFVVNIAGVRPRRLLEACAVRSSGGEALTGDDAERLLHLCLEHGTDHPERGSLHAMPEGTWKALLSTVRGRVSTLKQREERDNRSLHERRRQRYEDEHARKRRSAEQRLETTRQRSRGPAMEQLARAQIDAVERSYRQRLEQLDAGVNVQVDLELPPASCCIVEVS